MIMKLSNLSKLSARPKAQLINCCLLNLRRRPRHDHELNAQKLLARIALVFDQRGRCGERGQRPRDFDYHVRQNRDADRGSAREENRGGCVARARAVNPAEYISIRCARPAGDLIKDALRSVSKVE